MHCDIIAEGVITAVSETGLTLPLIVRLEGTNAKEGQQLLRESVLTIIPFTNTNKYVSIIVSIKNLFANGFACIFN